MSTFRDLAGQRFGRLTVIERAENIGRRTMWLCECDCGTRKSINGSSLSRGASTSCGCFHKEQLRERVFKHGARTKRKTTPEYSSWCNMMTRATNKNGERYGDYGGRNIGVCENWKSFENFLKDMGPRPRGTSLDRINNNLGYFPENCRWATSVEQAMNKRNNRLVEYRGETKTLKQWSDEMGIPYNTLYMRITQVGMTPEKAFNKPVGRGLE